MTDNYVTKSVKIVLCTIILFVGLLAGGLLQAAGHPLVNGVIIMVTLSVVTAVWKHKPSQGAK